MERREFCDLLDELLTRSGYSLTSDEVTYDYEEVPHYSVNYHEPVEMLLEAGCIPNWEQNNHPDYVNIYLDWTIPKEGVISL